MRYPTESLMAEARILLQAKDRETCPLSHAEETVMSDKEKTG
jgi:hypothetical protein